LLLTDIPDNRKAKIALIVLIRNISKEEAKTLALLLANKQAKSSTSAAVLKRRGQGGQGGKKANVKKETIKKEVKEEKDINIKEDIQKDSNNFPKVYNVLIQKRKNQPNSLYLANQYNTK
jgi:hypothetical protein